MKKRRERGREDVIELEMSQKRRMREIEREKQQGCNVGGGIREHRNRNFLGKNEVAAMKSSFWYQRDAEDIC
ncbi:hypothetical protein J437_LFUL003776 [Ladona fulva]|uniref:Uncharacterized protein n=1 Tax=Ladona fulva TaxID=123851 RepID=A0A8K0JUN3_LADFU|nr:hypothetical protein J437_LFUL003776 [Ladona fulva]